MKIAELMEMRLSPEVIAPFLGKVRAEDLSSIVASRTGLPEETVRKYIVQWLGFDPLKVYPALWAVKDEVMRQIRDEGLTRGGTPDAMIVVMDVAGTLSLARPDDHDAYEEVMRKISMVFPNFQEQVEDIVADLDHEADENDPDNRYDDEDL